MIELNRKPPVKTGGIKNEFCFEMPLRALLTEL
jgi:hypothetical protein